MSKTKIIGLDDDPTGSQTVHSCLLLTRWDVETLKQGVTDVAPLFFVLANTRGWENSGWLFGGALSAKSSAFSADAGGHFPW